MSDDEDMHAPSRVLKNDDFRKLLMTPRPGAATQQTPKGRDGQQKVRKQKPPKAKPPKPQEQAADAEDGPKYRDRAEERRRGINPDYDHLALPSFLNVGENAGQAELQHLSIEESKFLGGDVSHTHMVKGLDFQLLNKVREEMQAAHGVEGDGKAPKVVAPKAAALTFVTPLGRRVYDSIFRPQHVDVADLYRPRRTAFVYDLEDRVAGDVPTTLRRSKQDCPKVEDAMLAPIDGQVMERVAKIMSYMHVTGRKLKKKDKASLLAGAGGLVGAQGGLAVKGQAHAGAALNGGGASGPADEDDDIFEDAGKDYAPALPKEKANGAAPSGAREHHGSYFEDAKRRQGLPGPQGALPPAAELAKEIEENEEGEIADMEMGPARPTGDLDPEAAYGAAYPEADDMDEDDDMHTRLPPPPLPPQPKREAAAAARIPAADDDAYAECYPEYHGMADGGVDSDEEDFSHMDGKRDPARHEFATEEDWQNYKANKEQLPKAAFQFGVKAADGRKQGKNIGKQQDNKLNKDLQQIKGMLNDKYGDRHATAFDKDARAGLEGVMEEPRTQRSKRLRLG